MPSLNKTSPWPLTVQNQGLHMKIAVVSGWGFLHTQQLVQQTQFQYRFLENTNTQAMHKQIKHTLVEAMFLKPGCAKQVIIKCYKTPHMHTHSLFQYFTSFIISNFL